MPFKKICRIIVDLEKNTIDLKILLLNYDKGDWFG